MNQKIMIQGNLCGYFCLCLWWRSSQTQVVLEKSPPWISLPRTQSPIYMEALAEVGYMWWWHSRGYPVISGGKKVLCLISQPFEITVARSIILKMTYPFTFIPGIYCELNNIFLSVECFIWLNKKKFSLMRQNIINTCVPTLSDVTQNLT